MGKDQGGDALSDRARAGLELVGELLGPEIKANLGAIVASDAFGATMMLRGLENTYGDVWTRPGLSRAERSLVMIGVLVALRSEGELFQHVRIALHNGLSVDQVEEAIFQAAPYVGLIASLLAQETARRAIGDRASAAPD